MKNNIDSNKAIQSSLDTIVIFARIFVIVLIIAFLTSGIRRIDNSHEGLHFRFGKFYKKYNQNSGLVFAWPWPIDDIKIINVAKNKEITSNSFQKEVIKEEKNKEEEKKLPTYLITKDGNFLYLESKLTYSIKDSLLFYQQNDLDNQLLSLLDSCVLKYAQENTYNTIMESNSAMVENVKQILQDKLTKLQMGIVVNSITLKKESPEIIKQAKSSLSQLENSLQAQKNKAKSKIAKEKLAIQQKVNEFNNQYDLKKSAFDEKQKNIKLLLKKYRSLSTMKEKQEMKSLILNQYLKEIIPNTQIYYVLSDKIHKSFDIPNTKGNK